MLLNFEKSLPLICNNYSKIFNLKIKISGSLAYTDGSVIVIPRMDLNNEFNVRLIHGLLAHEAAHCRYSDFILLNTISNTSSFYKMLLNALEDIRIESLISKEFVGVYENLSLLHSYIGNKNYQNLKKNNSIPCLFLIIWYINIYLNIYVNNYYGYIAHVWYIYNQLKIRTNANFVRELTKILRKFLSCKSTSDVLYICDLIYDWVKVSSKDFQDKSEISNDKTLDNLLDENYSKENSQDNSNDKADTNDSINRLGERAIFRKYNDSLEIFNLIDSSRFFKDICEFINKEKVANLDVSSPRDDLGYFDIEKAIGSYVDENFLVRCLNRSRTLRKTFTRKAISYVKKHRSYAKKNGLIDPYKAQFLPYGEENLFKIKNYFRDFNTSIYIIGDRSGSMAQQCKIETHLDRCYMACESSLSLALALDSVPGIDVSVSYFPGNEFEVMEILEIGQKAFKNWPNFFQGACGSTPLAQAIWYNLHKALNDKKSNRKIFIIITDGIPDSVTQAKVAYDFAVSQGVEIYAIGIETSFVNNIFKNFILLNKADDLSISLFSLLQDIINKDF